MQLLGPVVQRTALAWQHRRRPRRQCVVSLLQVLKQNAPRHAVDHQVMNHQQQALLGVRQVDQHRAQQMPALQVQAALRRVGHGRQGIETVQLAQPKQFGIALSLRQRLPAIARLHKAQGQRFVLFDQRRQRLAQMHGVQCQGRLQHHRLVPVLALGNRRLEEAHLDRQQRQRPACHWCRDGSRFGFDQFGHSSQLADGLFFEQLLGAQLDALALGPGDDLQAEDRVATQFEEVIAAADSFELEHVGPDRRQLLLDLTDRRDELLADHAGHWQGTLVELAVRGQRQVVE